MLNRYYSSLEKKFYQWVVRKRVTIGIYIITLLLLPLVYIIPYVNLYVNSQLIIFLILSNAVIVFRIKMERLCLFLIILFIICIPLVLIRSYDRAELLINLAYGILFVGIISNIGILRRK